MNPEPNVPPQFSKLVIDRLRVVWFWAKGSEFKAESAEQ